MQEEQKQNSACGVLMKIALSAVHGSAPYYKKEAKSLKGFTRKKFGKILL